MKAAILHRKNEPLTVEDIEISFPLEYGQVKVKVLVSGLCGAQLQEIAGLKGNEKFMPHLLGHEGCGIVEEIGPGVTKVKPGNKVVMHWRRGSGVEAKFPIYTSKGYPISGGKVTTLSEYSIVSENRLTTVPANTPNDFVALLGCGLSTGLSVVNKDANVKFGESVFVLGCGGVGLNCILAAILSGAGDVIGMDICEEKKELVEKLGGKFLHLKELLPFGSGKFPIDCIIDTTGKLDLVSMLLPGMTERGRCILVAQPKANSQLSVSDPAKLFSTNGQSIRTTQAGGFEPDSDIPRYLNLQSSIDIGALVTDRFSLNNINDAIDKLKSGTAGRIMIDLC